MSNERFLELPIFSTGEFMRVKIKDIITKLKTNFQEILIIDTDEFGKCLVIDGVMQSAEKDHHLYDSELLKFLRANDRKILIMGGGDGYVAEMALKINPKLQIRIAELDNEVIKICKKNLGQRIFDNEKVKVYVGDALYYLKYFNKKTNGKFDGIVCDLTDSPIGRRNKQDFIDFYNDLVNFSKEALKDDGWISIQAGATETNHYYIKAVEILKGILDNYFSKVEKSDLYIPSYGEVCSFLFGKKR